MTLVPTASIAVAMYLILSLSPVSAGQVLATGGDTLAGTSTNFDVVSAGQTMRAGAVLYLKMHNTFLLHPWSIAVNRKRDAGGEGRETTTLIAWRLHLGQKGKNRGMLLLQIRLLTAVLF